jgi:hypothetical protein
MKSMERLQESSFAGFVLANYTGDIRLKSHDPRLKNVFEMIDLHTH